MGGSCLSQDATVANYILTHCVSCTSWGKYNSACTLRLVLELVEIVRVRLPRLESLDSPHGRGILVLQPPQPLYKVLRPFQKGNRYVSHDSNTHSALGRVAQHSVNSTRNIRGTRDGTLPAFADNDGKSHTRWQAAFL